MALHNRGMGWVTGLFFAWAGASAAQAGILVGSGALLTGTEHFSRGGLVVDVDYAVFAPTTYLGTDPSGGSDYVYAFQAFTESTATVPLATLTIGVANDSGGHNAEPDPTYPGATGANPSFMNLGPGSSSCLTYFGALGPGNQSTILLFTSPMPPTWDSATASGGGLSDQEQMPSPVPEPGTLALAALGSGLRVFGGVGPEGGPGAPL